MSGFDALRSFQRATLAPILFVTARRRELDEVFGLELGADDYITKPFDIDVLLARSQTVLRRSTISPELVTASHARNRGFADRST